MPPPRRPEPWVSDSRWRDGDRDDEARDGHNRDTRERRRAVAAAELDAVADMLLASLAEHGDLARAAELVGSSRHAVQGRMRWDPQWAARVDAVLAETCSGAPHCGTWVGYKRMGGRCADCREYKAEDRGHAPDPGRRRCEAPGCTKLLPAGARRSRRTCSASCRVAKSTAAARAARGASVRQRAELTAAQRDELGDATDVEAWTVRARTLLKRDAVSVAAIARAAELSAATVRGRLRLTGSGHAEAPPP